MFDPYRNFLAALGNESPVLQRALTLHRSERMGPMEFRTKPFLVELYADSRVMPDVVVRKAVQTGVSEWKVQDAFDQAGWLGRICAYVLPSYKLRNRFVQKRVNKILAAIPEYRALAGGEEIGLPAIRARDGARPNEGGAANLGLKRFGKGALLFLGSNTATDFVEFSADTLVVDEYDHCDQENLALAWDRLRESPDPRVCLIGNPTLPGVGIAREYDETDRRRWFMRCDRCGERQALDWFAHVVERDDRGTWRLRDGERAMDGGPIRPVCARCRKPFERAANGACWVAERPERDRRGYAMSRLDVLDDSLRELFIEWLRAQSVPELIRRFYNSVLGLPYQPEGARLTEETLDACIVGQPTMDMSGGESYAKHVVTAGIDVGAVLHVIVSIVERDAQDNAVRRAVHVAVVRTFEQAADILARFRVDIAVMDAQPELHKAQEFRDGFVKRGGTVVWLCRFHPTPRVGAQKYGAKLTYVSQLVQCDRTAVFDVSHDDIVSGRRAFPCDVYAVPEFAPQMKAPVRVWDKERGVIKWTEGSAPDHFRLADVYDRIACDLLDMGGSYSAGAPPSDDDDTPRETDDYGTVDDDDTDEDEDAG